MAFSCPRFYTSLATRDKSKWGFKHSTFLCVCWCPMYDPTFSRNANRTYTGCMETVLANLPSACGSHWLLFFRAISQRCSLFLSDVIAVYGIQPIRWSIPNSSSGSRQCNTHRKAQKRIERTTASAGSIHRYSDLMKAITRDYCNPTGRVTWPSLLAEQICKQRKNFSTHQSRFSLW